MSKKSKADEAMDFLHLITVHMRQIIEDSAGVAIGDSWILKRKPDGLVAWDDLEKTCWLGELRQAEAFLKKHGYE